MVQVPLVDLSFQSVKLFYFMKKYLGCASFHKGEIERERLGYSEGRYAVSEFKPQRVSGLTWAFYSPEKKGQFHLLGIE